MFRAILIVALVLYGASMLKSHDPEDSTQAFKIMNGAVQNLAAAASPHVLSFNDQVLQPAVNQAKSGPVITQDFAVHDPRAERNLNADIATAKQKIQDAHEKEKECAFSGTPAAYCGAWQ